MSKIFINYRSMDTASMAEFMDEKLVAHFGRDLVFRDDGVIPMGIDFRDFLWSHLKLAEVMLVLIGRHWLAKDDNGVVRLFRDEDFVRQEIAEALQRNIKVVPILVGGRERLSPEDLPDSIKDLAFRQYRYIRDRSSSRDIDALIVELAKAIGFTKPEVPAPEPAGIRQDVRVEGDVKNDRGAMTFGPGSPAIVQINGAER